MDKLNYISKMNPSRIVSDFSIFIFKLPSCVVKCNVTHIQPQHLHFLLTSRCQFHYQNPSLGVSLTKDIIFFSIRVLFHKNLIQDMIKLKYGHFFRPKVIGISYLILMSLNQDLG